MEKIVLINGKTVLGENFEAFDEFSVKVVGAVYEGVLYEEIEIPTSSILFWGKIKKEETI